MSSEGNTTCTGYDGIISCRLGVRCVRLGTSTGGGVECTGSTLSAAFCSNSYTLCGVIPCVKHARQASHCAQYACSVNEVYRVYEPHRIPCMYLPRCIALHCIASRC